MRPKVVIAGILDTKGEEIKFIAQAVREAGGEPTVMELSVGKETGWADIGLSELLVPIGKKPADLYAVDRHKAAGWVTEAAIGGSMGASISSAVMQSLPIGVPKMLVTTMASGEVRPYVGTKDICMMYPIAEAGLNSLTKQILTNAAYGIVGMASAPKLPAAESKPLIGCMMFGVTTPCVLRASQSMEKLGYDVIINHAIGTGGMSMEQMIDDGFIKGVLDITTHELIDELLGGVLSAGPDRLTAAARKGVPQVVAPGGLDLINFGAKDTVPTHYMEQTHLPGRSLYEHNPTVTCVGVLPEEAREIARQIGEKLSVATGPVAVCVPMRGWGACDIREPNKELGWAGPSAGPSWIADPERPEWSLRSRSFIAGLKETLDLSKPNIEVLVADMHMNEPEFADLMSGILQEMLDGRWKKGLHSGGPIQSLS